MKKGMSNLSFTVSIEYIIFSVEPENIKSDKQGAKMEMSSLLPPQKLADKL